MYCRRCLALWLGGRLASSPERPLVSTMRSCQVAGILACYHTQPDDAIKLAVRAAFASQISVSSREVEHDLNQQARALVSTCQSAGSADSAVAASFPAPQSAAGSAAEGRRGLTASQPVRQGADAFPVDTARSVITPREEDHRHESSARTADRPLLGQRQPAAGALSQDRREYGGHPVTAAGGRPPRGHRERPRVRRESAASTADTALQQAVDQRPSSRGSARGDISSQAVAKRELDEHGCTVGFATLEDLPCGQGSPRDSSGSSGSSSEEEDNTSDPRSSEGVKHSTPRTQQATASGSSVLLDQAMDSDQAEPMEVETLTSRLLKGPLHIELDTRADFPPSGTRLPGRLSSPLLLSLMEMKKLSEAQSGSLRTPCWMQPPAPNLLQIFLPPPRWRCSSEV